MAQHIFIYLKVSYSGRWEVAKRAAKKSGRTEAMSLRLDPKDKFILDYICRVSGMGITTVIERAIQEYAKTAIGDVPAWKEFWDVSEGVRTIKMLSHQDVTSTYEEDELVEFVDKFFELFHWPYDPYEREISEIILHKDRIDVLWPKIHEYVEQWRETKISNPGAVERVMAEALLAAGVSLPRKWERIFHNESASREIGLDDPIPF